MTKDLSSTYRMGDVRVTTTKSRSTEYKIIDTPDYRASKSINISFEGTEQWQILPLRVNKEDMLNAQIKFLNVLGGRKNLKKSEEAWQAKHDEYVAWRTLFLQEIAEFVECLPLFRCIEILEAMSSEVLDKTYDDERTRDKLKYEIAARMSVPMEEVPDEEAMRSLLDKRFERYLLREKI